MADPDTCLIRPINGNDVGISATNIIRANPGNWALSKPPSLLNFTAQTAAASSYGYMQPMYVTAREQGWRGSDGICHPAELFLPKENISAGTMKLRWSTDFGSNITEPNFSSSSEVDEAFGLAFEEYNGGSNADYRPDVEERIPNFLPVLSRQIFMK
jgi:hypothetical protein